MLLDLLRYSTHKIQKITLKIIKMKLYELSRVYTNIARLIIEPNVVSRLAHL
jgi:hypothetical protein